MSDDAGKPTANQGDETLSQEPPLSKVKEIDQEVQEVKVLMKANLEKVIDRGEKIDRLEQKADELKLTTNEWKKSTKKLSCMAHCRACCFFCPCI